MSVGSFFVFVLFDQISQEKKLASQFHFGRHLDYHEVQVEFTTEC
jgi:hypothetical protein